MTANKQDAGGLLPCPFCGGTNIRTEHDELIPTGGYDYMAVCGDCGGSSDYFKSREETVAAWTRRNGEQCRAASVEDSAVNAVLTTIRRERDAWLSWNHDHPEQAAVTTPDVLEMAANLIRALSRGVPEGK